MKLGSFSVSLAVKDINASQAFYEKLGFSLMGGNIEQNWLIMKNGETVIGLFQGMFDSNLMTFNPGWDQSAQNLEEFTDVREIYQKVKQEGIKIDREGISGESGPSHFAITDPDGNVILFDQHR